VGEFQFRRLEKKLSTLPTLWRKGTCLMGMRCDAPAYNRLILKLIHRAGVKLRLEDIRHTSGPLLYAVSFSPLCIAMHSKCLNVIGQKIDASHSLSTT
jgi:hypothetical protein